MNKPLVADHPDQMPGTNLMHHSKGMEEHTTSVDRAFRALTRLNTGHDTRNVHHRLAAYRVLTEGLMDAYQRVNAVMLAQGREIEQMQGAKGVTAGKRWTPEQDEGLVEMACRDDSNMLELALAFNRTPAAIASRLTYLVGVSKVSRHVVGRITGYLDGEAVSGLFDGEIRP